MSKIITAVVVSNKMQNTIVVDVQREYQHPRFKKVVTQHKKFKVHVEGEKPAVGEMVSIISTKPISKDKHFMLVTKNVPVEKVEKAKAEKPAPKSKKAETKAEIEVPVEKKTKPRKAKKAE